MREFLPASFPGAGAEGESMREFLPASFPGAGAEDESMREYLPASFPRPCLIWLLCANMGPGN